VKVATRPRPRVLVVSVNAWREGSGITTLMDLFRGWDPTSLAQVYTRSALPGTAICSRFFRISESAVLRSIASRNVETGAEVTAHSSSESTDREATDQERKRYALGHAFIFTVARELVWWMGVWKTPALNRFLDDYKPEVLFLPIYPSIYMCRIQEYVLSRARVPAVCYMADDNYTYKPCGWDPLRLLHRALLRRRVRRIIDACSEVFVIVPQLKREYDAIFGIDSKLLTRGIDPATPAEPLEQPHLPVRFVYAGKLILDRWRSLGLIVRALDEVNRDGVRATLDIYSTDIPSREQRAAIESQWCSFRGRVSSDEVSGLLADSDVLVFVEALTGRYRHAARLSFSTKLTDYMGSGRCIFAIGPAGSAPIDYLKSEDAAICATSASEVVREVQRIVIEPDLIAEYAGKAAECGVRNHDESVLRARLYESLESVSLCDTA